MEFNLLFFCFIFPFMLNEIGFFNKAAIRILDISTLDALESNNMSINKWQLTYIQRHTCIRLLIFTCDRMFPIEFKKNDLTKRDKKRFYAKIHFELYFLCDEFPNNFVSKFGG